MEECSSIFTTPQERRGHCIQDHQFPHDFRFDDARKQKTKHCKLKDSNEGLVDFVMEVDPNPGDSNSEMNIKKPKSKSKPKIVAVLPQSLKVLGCGNADECNQKNEEGTLLGEATSAQQAGRHMCTEGFGKPFSFVRGRGKYQRLGGTYVKFNSGINKREQSSSSNSNVWGTSGLLDALQGARVGSDEKFACTSDTEEDKK